MERSCWRILQRLVALIALIITPLYGYVGTVAAQPGDATLQLTMRGCPEGVDPRAADPASTCTIPLDAPDVSVLTWVGGAAIPVPATDRSWDGTYHVAVPANTAISLIGFAPVLRDDFVAVGADGEDENGDPFVTLSAGQTRHISIYYFYYPPGSGPQATTGSVVDGYATVRIGADILGWPFTAGCFELVGFGEPVCSEYVSDMTYEAIFQNVPVGTYTVRQTAMLDDVYIADFVIEVTGGDQKFMTEVVHHFGSPSRLGAPALSDFGIEPIPYDTLEPGFFSIQANHVSVVFIDTSTHQKIISDACVQIVGVSEIQCDTHRGQIDFLDVPAERHDLVVTHIPEGYVLAPGFEELYIEPYGRNQHAPMHIAYYIDLDPVSDQEGVADPGDAAQVDTPPLMICASNRHGVDYPAMIFNLPVDVALELGFMVLDGNGNLVPEWMGVREGACSDGSGFHLYEYVALPSSVVTYCDNGVDRGAPADSIGVEFVDPGVQGQSLVQGKTFVNWRTAPVGVYPGTCSAPIGQ